MNTEHDGLIGEIRRLNQSLAELQQLLNELRQKYNESDWFVENAAALQAMRKQSTY